MTKIYNKLKINEKNDFLFGKDLETLYLCNLISTSYTMDTKNLKIETECKSSELISILAQNFSGKMNLVSCHSSKVG